MLEIVKGPYLQWPEPGAMTIMWETSAESDSTVTVWRTVRGHRGLRKDEDSRESLDDTRPCCIHSMTLRGLSPETTYTYRVRSRDAQGELVESPEHPLKTAPYLQTPFSFAVTSETGGFGNDAINRRVFRRIRQCRPDFLLVVGDAVGDGREYGDWERYFFGPGRELFNDTPFFLCPGNHEENADWFYRFVGYPEPKNFYSFKYGNALFVALDSTRLVDYGEAGPRRNRELDPGSAQCEFLINELRSSEAAWKIVFFHYPPYVSGDYQVDPLRELCPVFEAHGVDLVFNSHTIVYERSHPLRANEIDLDAGITYIVAGGAGAAPQWFNPKRAWHTAQSLAVPHFVHVVIAGPTLELRAVDQRGCPFDALQLSKR